MNAKLIARLEALENMIRKPEVPDMIQISYIGDGFKVTESYFQRGKNGNIVNGGKYVNGILDNYKEYIFTEDCHARVLLDTIGYPDINSGNVYTFSCDEIRKLAGLPKNAAFSIACISQHQESLITEFGVYERIRHNFSK
ncbi:hypothetical protein UYO_2954 [Lachnospiraceae bacterium JC7]|nr:hypothetical protein UYO_2954 [Lachnospiraceae bacterium JC7]